MFFIEITIMILEILGVRIVSKQNNDLQYPKMCIQYFNKMYMLANFRKILESCIKL